MKTNKLFISFLLVVSFFTANSQRKSQVKVIFEVMEKEYVDYYGHYELDKIEKLGTDSIVSLFNKYIPMFQFVKDGNHYKDSLMVQLIRRDGGTKSSFWIDWKMSLKGLNVKPSDILSLDFANQTTFENPLSDNLIDFVNYIHSVLDRQFNQDINQTSFIDIIFRNIILTKKVDSIDYYHNKWILPFTYEYLNIGWQSQFKVDHIVVENYVESYRPFECVASGKTLTNDKIVLEACRPVRLSNLNIKSLIGVYITRYNPYDL